MIIFKANSIIQLAVLAVVAVATSAAAQSISIGGSWSGRGSVTLPSGNTEAVRCRATFTQFGNGASMSATCANASTKVSQTAELSRVGGNRFAGEFHNPEYNISGSIRITVHSASSMSASLSGGGGSASIQLGR